MSLPATTIKLCRPGNHNIPCATPARMLYRHNRRIRIIHIQPGRDAPDRDRPLQRLGQVQAVLAEPPPEPGDQPRVIIDFTDRPCERPPRPANCLLEASRTG